MDRRERWAWDAAEACWQSFVQYPTFIVSDTAVRAIATVLVATRSSAIREERMRIVEAVERAIGRGVADGGVYRADIHSAIEAALTAARKEGRHQREKELIAHLHREVANARNLLDVVEEIERGLFEKEGR